MDIKDLVIDCGTKVIPGTRSKLYLVCECDIDTFPSLTTPATNPGDGLLLDGDIVLKTTKKFAALDIILDSGNIKHNMVGVRGSKNYSNTLDFKVVKNAASDEWFNEHPNACLVGLIRQKDGKIRVFGEPEMPAFLETADGDGGTNNESEAAWTAQIKDSTGHVAYYYEGAIDLTTAP